MEKCFCLQWGAELPSTASFLHGSDHPQLFSVNPGLHPHGLCLKRFPEGAVPSSTRSVFLGPGSGAPARSSGAWGPEAVGPGEHGCFPHVGVEEPCSEDSQPFHVPNKPGAETGARLFLLPLPLRGHFPGSPQLCVKTHSTLRLPRGAPITWPMYLPGSSLRLWCEG